MREKPLKVLSVCTSLGGGAGRAAYRIHQGVRMLGVDSRMLLKGGKSNDPSIVTLDEFIPQNPLYKAFDWTRNKVKNKVQYARWNRYPERDNIFMSDLRAMDIHGVLKKLDYDVLHLHWINQRFLPLRELPKDKPIVWTLHDSWPFCGVCHYFFECKEYQWKCGCCPFLHSDNAKDLSYRIWKKKAEIYQDLDLHIVSPSHWLGDCAKQSSLFRQLFVSVIPNCLDVKVFRPLDEKEILPRWRNFQEKRLVKPFLLYGAMNAATDKRKGFANLLSALKILKQNGNADDFELIVFGANKSDLDIEVDFPIHYVGNVGNVEELVSLYNLASVMVVPSLSEVFGQTASEALSCGTPVVAFQCTGIQEVVNHKVDGYLAQPYVSEDLAKGILWCLENNVDNCLGNAGREKVLQKYTFDSVCQQYKSLYESLI